MMQAGLQEVRRDSLWRRFARFAWGAAFLLVASGVGLSWWIYHLHALSSIQTRVLETEVVAARAMLDSTHLISALDRSYGTHNATYLASQLTPWRENLLKSDEHLERLLQQIPQDTEVRQAVVGVRAYIQQESALAQKLIDAAQADNWALVDIRARSLRIAHRQLLLSVQEVIQEGEYYRQIQFQHLQTAVRRGSLALPLATVVALLLLVAAAFETRRLVIQPLHDLIRQVEAFASGDFTQRVTVPREDEIGHLAHTFNLMADKIQQAYSTLNEQVEERTRALQRRTAQLQAATEIGRAVSALRDLDDLLREATRLVAQRYGFYHVGVFLTQPGGKEAVLKGVYNWQRQIAQQLLDTGYTIDALGADVASQAFATGRLHTAQFGPGEHPVALLSATRSELAIPLRSGEEILGVLDVHADRPQTFTPEDITSLQAVADLLAVALDNARLLRETQEALATARHAYETLASRDWRRFLQTRRVFGYRVVAGKMEAIGETPLLPAEAPQTVEEVVEASPAGESAGQASEKAAREKRYLLRLPVRARGRVVAVAHLRKNTPWKNSEKRLLERLSERLGTALEAASLYAQAQRSAAQLQIAAEIARDASATLDLDELLRKAVRLVKERFGFYHASVFLLDESGEYAYVKESTGEAGRHLKERRHRLAVGSHSVVGQALARREVVVVNDVTKSDIHHFNPLLPETRAELGIPLMAGDQLIGVLDVQAVYAGAFGDEDIRVLRILADQLAIAVVNARLFAVTQAFVERSRRIREITRRIVGTAKSLEEAYRIAVESIAAFRPENIVTYWVPDPKAPSEALLLAASAPLSVEAWEGERRRVVSDDPIWSQVLSERRPVAVEKATAPAWRPLIPSSRASMLVPMVYAGEVSGVLVLESPRPADYDAQDQTMSQALAGSLGAIFANIRLLEQVQEHARRLQLLYEITSSVASRVDLQDLLEDLTRRLQQGFGLLHCGVVLFDDNGETGTLVASSSAPGAPAQDMVGIKLPLTNAMIQEAIRTHRPVLCRDVESDPRVADIRDVLRERATRQLIVVPLLARDRVIGTLGLDIGDLETEVTEEELRLLEQIAHQIATSVEVARLFRQAVRTAERERLVTEITTKMRATNDPREILQTAVEELRRALHAQQAQVVFVDERGTDG